MLRSVPAGRFRSEPGVPSNDEPGKGHEPKPQDRSPQLVRVELVDGRAAEGWRKATGEGNGLYWCWMSSPPMTRTGRPCPHP
jgi:hypothetical protein